MKKKIKVNDKVYFSDEPSIGYWVKACNDRYAILTRPYNPRRTVIYTIWDMKENIRSTNDYVFNPYDYNKQEDIDLSLTELMEGKYKLSTRHQVNVLGYEVAEFIPKKRAGSISN
jgi:hypothetical protein